VISWVATRRLVSDNKPLNCGDLEARFYHERRVVVAALVKVHVQPPGTIDAIQH
jgi:hypothetical protein